MLTVEGKNLGMEKFETVNGCILHRYNIQLHKTASKAAFSLHTADYSQLNVTIFFVFINN